MMDSLQISEDYVDNTEDVYQFASGKWNLKEYLKRIIVSVVNENSDKMEIEFDLVNVEAPIANALRRVLVAEVPTMAIEKIYLYQNTSCIQDEVLCHRIGLLPICADHSKFEFCPQPNDTSNKEPSSLELIDEEPAGDPQNNIIFNLKVSCPHGDSSEDKRKKAKGKQRTASATHARNESHLSLSRDNTTGNWTLYSSAFIWHPLTDQERRFAKNPPHIVHNDIIIAKLRPGQEIEASCHCVKGVGRDHAKFSPVATATYRLLPEIKLTKRVDGENAITLKSCFSSGVIEINPSTGTAYVANARNDTSSRNVYQYDELKDSVQMSKKKNHFIFSVESTGVSPGCRLVADACSILKEKTEALRSALKIQLSTKSN